MNNGDASRGDRLAPWAMLALTLLALSAGWALRASVLERTRVVEARALGVRVSVPSDWQGGVVGDGAEARLVVRDPRDPYATLAVEVRDLGASDVALAQQGYFFELGQTLAFYRPLGATREVALGSDSAVQITYAYVLDPAAGSPFGAGYPVVIAGTSSLIARGGRLYIITTTADAAHYDDARAAQLEALIQAVHLP